MNYDADAHFSLQIISLHVARAVHSCYIYVSKYLCFVYIVIIIRKMQKKMNSETKSSLVWGQTTWTAGEYVTSENLGTFAL